MPGRSLAVLEFVDALADALAWPRSRPCRVVLGDRSSSVSDVSLCVNEDALSGIKDPSSTVLLATPAGAAFARSGRRDHDVFLGEGEAADWARAERVVLDASEMLSGGRGGFDDQLLSALDLPPSPPLASVPLDEVKFVMYVPVEAVGAIREAVFAAGAGMIGDYTECSYAVEGTGTFRGGDSSNPAVGKAGESEQVRELRVETVCRAHLRDQVARAYVAAHPYEEPAYDVYPLLTPSSVGLGRLVEPGHSLADIHSRLAYFGGTVEVSEARQGPPADGMSVAITTLPVGPVLAATLTDESVGMLVASHATAAQRVLLAERGVTLLLVDQAALVRYLGDPVAVNVAAHTGIPTRLVSPLAFPDGR